MLRSRLKAYLSDGSWTAAVIRKPVWTQGNFSRSPVLNPNTTVWSILQIIRRKNSNSVVADWMDAVANRRLTASEIARLRRELAGRPAELRRFEQEQALNSLLDARFATPAVSSNFAARWLNESPRKIGKLGLPRFVVPGGPLSGEGIRHGRWRP